ncbi:MAG: type I methionyl aminopeptidase [Gammaproteobacteria bacterium]|jgi:methionyl aminopeptidase
MATKIKTAEEIKKIRIACQLASDVLTMIEPHIQVGITTLELDRLCYDYIVNVQKAHPAPLNYKGYPNSICTSLNHVICHGIPSDRKLKYGDILNIDVTVLKDEYYGDTSKMFIIGKASIMAERLVRVSKECLYLGIEAVKPGGRLGDIGATIQKHAESNHYSVVRDYCGHGIGRGFHEDPQVLHFGTPNTGEELKPGMVFTIEPMINAGKHHIRILADNWTAVTKDHSLSAQWEHTLLVTETGHEILTKWPEEKEKL